LRVELRVLEREEAFACGRAKPTGEVFASKVGTPLGFRNIVRCALEAALRVAGLDRRVRWHDLRHCYASLLRCLVHASAPSRPDWSSARCLDMSIQHLRRSGSRPMTALGYVGASSSGSSEAVLGYAACEGVETNATTEWALDRWCNLGKASARRDWRACV
jgi:hypothetical protein